MPNSERMFRMIVWRIEPDQLRLFGDLNSWDWGQILGSGVNYDVPPEFLNPGFTDLQIEIRQAGHTHMRANLYLHRHS